MLSHACQALLHTSCCRSLVWLLVELGLCADDPSEVGLTAVRSAELDGDREGPVDWGSTTMWKLLMAAMET